MPSVSMWGNERDSHFKVSERIFLMGQTHMRGCTMPSTLYVTVNCITMETTTVRKGDERVDGRGERQKLADIEEKSDEGAREREGKGGRGSKETGKSSRLKGRNAEMMLHTSSAALM